MKKFFIFLTINCCLGLLCFFFGYLFFEKVENKPPTSFSSTQEETNLDLVSQEEERTNLEASWKKIVNQYLNNHNSKIVITYPFANNSESDDSSWKLNFNNILKFYQIDTLEGNSIQKIVAADSNLPYSKIDPETKKELEALIKISDWEQKLNSLIWASQLYSDFITFSPVLEAYQIFKIKEIEIEILVQWMNDASKEFPPFYSYLLKESDSDETVAKVQSIFEKFISQFETAEIESLAGSKTKEKWNLEYEINLIKKKMEDDWTEIKDFLLEKFTYRIDDYQPLLEYNFNKIRDYNIIKIDGIYNRKIFNRLSWLTSAEIEWKDVKWWMKKAAKNLIKIKDWKNKISEQIKILWAEIGPDYQKLRNILFEKIGPVNPDSYDGFYGVQLRNKLKKYSIFQIDGVDVSPLHQFMTDRYNREFKLNFQWGLVVSTYLKDNFIWKNTGNLEEYLAERPEMKKALDELRSLDQWEQKLENAFFVAEEKKRALQTVSETLKREIEQDKDYYDHLFNFWKEAILPHQPKLKKYQISEIDGIKIEAIVNLENSQLLLTEEMDIFHFFTFLKESLKEEGEEQIEQELKALVANDSQIKNFLAQFETLYYFWKQEIAPYLVKLEKYQIDQIIGIKIDALIDLNYFVQNELKQIKLTNFKLYLDSDPKIELQLEALLAKIVSDPNISDVRSKIIVEINESEQLQAVLDQFKKFSSYLKQYAITTIEGVSLVEILQASDQNLSIYQLKLQKEATFQKVKTKILALKKLSDYQTEVLRVIASAQNKSTRKESDYFIIGFLAVFTLLFLTLFSYFLFNKKIKHSKLLSFWKKTK